MQELTFEHNFFDKLQLASIEFGAITSADKLLRIKSSNIESKLRGQTVHWVGAQFCVCMFLDSTDKSLNMFQNVNGFHLQNFRGFRVQYL